MKNQFLRFLCIIGLCYQSVSLKNKALQEARGLAICSSLAPRFSLECAVAER